MPSSYKPPMRGDTPPRAQSQSTETNLSTTSATVADILAQKGGAVYALRPQDTIKQAVLLLKEKRIGALLVTDRAGAMTGILSERDIVRKLAETPGQTLPQRVEEVMTPKVETCAPEEALVTVLRRMTDGRFRHMPVLTGGQLVGMITIGDVVNFRLTALEHEALQMKQLIVG